MYKKQLPEISRISQPIEGFKLRNFDVWAILLEFAMVKTEVKIAIMGAMAGG